jgi:hypothetical protein
METSPVTINLPKLANWKTTLIGILSTVGGGLYQHYLNGGLTMPVAIGLSIWLIFCYIVPDAAKSNPAGEAQTEALIAAMFAKVQAAQVPDKTVQAASDAPATDASGFPVKL